MDKLFRPTKPFISPTLSVSIEIDHITQYVLQSNYSIW